MILKLSSYLIAFLLAFGVSISISSALSYGSAKRDSETRLRVSKFLFEDARKMKATYDRLDKRGDTSATLFVKILQDRSDEISSMDISRMPEDFQAAWIKYVSADREWSDFIAGLKSMPETLDMDDAEMHQADEIIARQREAWSKLKDVADQYDVELLDFGIVSVK